jgi:flagellar hook assembly protein FlgD
MLLKILLHNFIKVFNNLNYVVNAYIILLISLEDIQTYKFSLPENVGNVKLSIYNALGEKVVELINTALVAGKYSYQWNAQNVAIGMYIIELRTGNFVATRKMILIKHVRNKFISKP